LLPFGLTRVKRVFRMRSNGFIARGLTARIPADFTTAINGFTAWPVASDRLIWNVNCWFLNHKRRGTEVCDVVLTYFSGNGRPFRSAGARLLHEWCLLRWWHWVRFSCEFRFRLDSRLRAMETDIKPKGHSLELDWGLLRENLG